MSRLLHGGLLRTLNRSHLAQVLDATYVSVTQWLSRRNLDINWEPLFTQQVYAVVDREHPPATWQLIGFDFLAVAIVRIGTGFNRLFDLDGSLRARNRPVPLSRRPIRRAVRNLHFLQCAL